MDVRGNLDLAFYMGIFSVIENECHFMDFII